MATRHVDGKTYRILSDVRGHHDFQLERFLDEILRSCLLVKTGDEGVRFAYPGLQSYYSAQYLSTLGRLSRVRWWHDTLVVLAGLLDRPNPLLRMILSPSCARSGGEPSHNRARSRWPRNIIDRLSFEIAEDVYWQLTGGLSAETYLPSWAGRPEPRRGPEGRGPCPTRRFPQRP